MAVMTKTATFIRTVGWPGDARLYRLDPPLDGHDHVIVSAIVVRTFAASAEGAAAGDGGALDHEQALRNAGYEVTS